MPVVDTFPALLREDLENAFEQDIDRVFDVAQVRRSLSQQKADLELELRRVYYGPPFDHILTPIMLLTSLTEFFLCQRY